MLATAADTAARCRLDVRVQVGRRAGARRGRPSGRRAHPQPRAATRSRSPTRSWPALGRRHRRRAASTARSSPSSTAGRPSRSLQTRMHVRSPAEARRLGRRHARHVHRLRPAAAATASTSPPARCAERRATLERLAAERPGWTVSPSFDDGAGHRGGGPRARPGGRRGQAARSPLPARARAAATGSRCGSCAPATSSSSAGRRDVDASRRAQLAASSATDDGRRAACSPARSAAGCPRATAAALQRQLHGAARLPAGGRSRRPSPGRVVALGRAGGGRRGRVHDSRPADGRLRHPVFLRHTRPTSAPRRRRAMADTGRDGQRRGRRPHAVAVQSGQGALPGDRLHQGRGDRLLHPDRARPAAAPRRPAADGQAVSRTASTSSSSSRRTPRAARPTGCAR